MIIAALTFAVILGGIKTIGRAAEKLSPLKVALYLLGGLIVIVTHASLIPETLALVFREAFSTKAAIGSAQGIGVMVALRYGLARGVYAPASPFEACQAFQPPKEVDFLGRV